MPSESLIKPYQLVTVENLVALGILSGTTYDVATDALNKRLTFSCQITASIPPTAVINVGAINVLTEDGRTLLPAPLDGVLQIFTGATINPVTNATTGNVKAFTFPTATAAGQYIRLVLQLDPTGYINLTSTLPGPSLGGVGSLPFLNGMIPLGMVDLISLGAGTLYEGASSVTSTVNSQDITQFFSGVSNDAKEFTSIKPADGFQAAVYDYFALGPNQPGTFVYSPNTNAQYDQSNKLYKMLCDQTTTATTTGTAYTLSANPNYTVQPGDVIYSGGIFRAIQTVSTQSTGTLDSAFPVDLVAAVCQVSQAVWTQDLTNVGRTVNTTAAASFPATSVPDANIYYEDSFAVGDNIPDYILQANIVVSASNSGAQLSSGIPPSNTFTPPFIRSAMPNQIQNYDLVANSPEQRFFLVFFPNSANASVTTSANLIGYEASFYGIETLPNGGYLDSAWAMSDGSGAAINVVYPFPLDPITNTTLLVLSWNYVPQINLGQTTSDVSFVLINGQAIPRRVAGSTQDAWFEEYPGSTNILRLWMDVSAASPAVSIEVRRMQGAIDTTDQNRFAIASYYDAVVGSAQQVATGAAGFTSIQTALNYVGLNGTVLVLKGSYTENITITGQQAVWGQGASTILNGNLEYLGTAIYSRVATMQITGNIIFDSGSTGNFLSDCWQIGGGTFNDLGTDNNFLGLVQEP